MIEPEIDGTGEHAGVTSRHEHRRMECRAACPVDVSGKCAEHSLIRWILALLVTIGLMIVAFAWSTSITVKEGLAQVEKAMAVVTFAQQANNKAMVQLLAKKYPPEEFVKQFERLEDRVNVIQTEISKHPAGDK